MKHGLRTTSAALPVFALVSVVLAQPAGKAAPAEWTPGLMMQVKQVSSVQVSPDGKRVAFSVRQAITAGDKSEYRTHIHLANADGNDPVQLTQGEQSCEQPRWSPDGQTLAFLSTRDGKRNIWLIPARGGEARPLTHSKTGVTSLKWSPDGKAIAFTAMDEPTPEEEKAAKAKNDARVVDENIKMSRLYVVGADKAGTPKLLTREPRSVGSESGVDRRGGYDWSPDGKTIVFSHTRTPSPDDWPTADLALVDVNSGTVKPLVQAKAAEFSPLFSPDGQWIAYVASDNPPTWGGDGTVHVIPSGGGSSRQLAETFDRFGRYSELVGWSADGKRLFYTEARGTVLRLGALPLSGTPEEVSKADGVFSGGVSLNSSRTMFGFGWETLVSAPEAALSSVERFDAKTISRVNTDLPRVPLAQTEVVRWKSADGLAVEGLLTYPLGYEKGKRYPTLLVIHGGPMGVFTQSFTGSPSQYPIATFVARGYAVLRPNPRGSSGYGKKFRYANYGDWGGGDFKDLMAGVDHVIDKGIADPDRLGVMGWSYGGFMTSWTITQTKRFKAASVGAGVTNLMSFTGTADIPGFLPDYFAGEPWDKLDVYRAHSAMFQVKGVTTPTLIQHGERDRRVPLSQGQELYNALKRQGCTTQMVVYPRTPHGIEEPKLLVDCMERNLQWFDKYLRSK
jgi:dipeptidyl aminopeptidase/acylaminoacyl peptidase